MIYDNQAHRRLLLLSFEDRDGLDSQVKNIGWDVISARRSENLLARFIGAATTIAMIDLRALPDSAISEIEELSSFIEANGFSMIIAIDPTDSKMIGNAMKFGATHIMNVDCNDTYLKANLDIAFNMVVRLHGEGPSSIMEERHSRILNYSWSLKDGRLEVGSNIAKALNHGLTNDAIEYLDRIYPKTRLFRSLNKEQRKQALLASKRLKIDDRQIGFPHNFGGYNYIHHLQKLNGEIRGYLEEVSEFEAWRSHDILTGVTSGSFARNRLLTWNQDDEGPLNLIIFGLRQLEHINTRFGRTHGNILIQHAGERISHAMSVEKGGNGFVSRIAGREFLLLINKHCNIDELTHIAETVIAELLEPFNIDGESFHISARAGICIAGPKEDGMSALRRASLALSDVMSDGNMIVGSSSEPITLHPLYDDNIEREIRRAVENNQIEVVLQPQFDVENGALLGAEALARWNHPTLGRLGADTLFSVADRCDYRDALSQHIQDIALNMCAKWPAALSNLRLSINVTAYQMGSSQFTHDLIQMISNSGFDPSRLTIELTEENLIQNMEFAIETLRVLREKGIKIAIDDFGTGYSSLAYITELPLDYLKLDKALIRNILRSNKDIIVLRSIIAMAKAVGVKIIAEGVESEAVLSLLRNENCDIYQGYYGSRPLAEEAFENFAMISN